VQQLAARALTELTKRFNLPPTPRTGIARNAFIGVHIRSEIDAVNVGYTSYELQEEAYLHHINNTALRAIYAASGNTTSLDLFSRKAETLSPSAQVVTKMDLLSDDDLQYLSTLTWDQQALVDYLILERSSLFLGVSDSSFSWGLVYSRQSLSDRGLCNITEPQLQEGMEYQDNLSVIWGTPRDWHRYKLWP